MRSLSLSLLYISSHQQSQVLPYRNPDRAANQEMSGPESSSQFL